MSCSEAEKYSLISVRAAGERSLPCRISWGVVGYQYTKIFSKDFGVQRLFTSSSNVWLCRGVLCSGDGWLCRRHCWATEFPSTNTGGSVSKSLDAVLRRTHVLSVQPFHLSHTWWNLIYIERGPSCQFRSTLDIGELWDCHVLLPSFVFQVHSCTQHVRSCENWNSAISSRIRFFTRFFKVRLYRSVICFRAMVLCRSSWPAPESPYTNIFEGHQESGARSNVLQT